MGFILATWHLAGLSEPEHWLEGVVFMGLPSLAIAGVLNWLYRTTKGDSLAVIDAT